MQDGDYIIMEDQMADPGRAEWLRFLRNNPSTCPIDTKYTDFFGVNMMCAYDGIIRVTLQPQRFTEQHIYTSYFHAMSKEPEA